MDAIAATPLHDASDAELIRRYLDAQDQSAMRVLVERHHDPIYRRFRREMRNEADAEDWSQRLWIQVMRHLGTYRDEGKFPQFLSTIASNMIKDHWRQKATRARVLVESDDTEEDHARQGRLDDRVDPERNLINDEMVTHLVRDLIPALPADQRTAWLLRHESEYWEPGRPFEWSHLAELNGVAVERTWQVFESARAKFMRAVHQERADGIEAEEMLVFLVWTQAQRATKDESFSWDYFAELIGVPVNTMKTRYRAAQRRLAEALDAYRSES